MAATQRPVPGAAFSEPSRGGRCEGQLGRQADEGAEAVVVPVPAGLRRLPLHDVQEAVARVGAEGPELVVPGRTDAGVIGSTGSPAAGGRARVNGMPMAVRTGQRLIGVPKPRRG
jgi:hypothetical protein